MGVSDLWTPDEAVFAAGWAELVARHPALRATHATDNPRRRVLGLARGLLAARALEKATDAADDEGAEKPEGWDAARVARHVERAAAQAYQTFRRARWLRLLHDADVVCREPEGAGPSPAIARHLTFRGGELCGAVDVTPAEGAKAPSDVPGAWSSQPPFDRAKYDRMRILTTELKRIVRDGGEVAVVLRGGRPVPSRWLAGLWRLV